MLLYFLILSSCLCPLFTLSALFDVILRLYAAHPLSNFGVPEHMPAPSVEAVVYVCVCTLRLIVFSMYSPRPCLLCVVPVRMPAPTSLLYGVLVRMPAPIVARWPF